MITHIDVKDFAIIKHISVDIGGGLSVITGETGAGKSVVIEALSLALGSRADKSMVRTGTDKAVISVVADSGDEVILIREVSAGGKSIAKLNGEIVTLQELLSGTAKIADIHGQYDHQSLLKPEHHIEILDNYGAEYLKPAGDKVRSAFGEYSEAKKALNKLLNSEQVSDRELDFLKFEIEEIDRIAPRLGEDEKLREQIKLMQSSERIFEALSTVTGLIKGNDSDEIGLSVLESLGRAERELLTITDISKEYEAMSTQAKDAYFMLDELASSAAAGIDNMSFSEADLDKAMTRLDELDRLSAKYGGSLSGVLSHYDEANERIANVVDSSKQKDLLSAVLAEKEKVLRAESETLSKLRRKIAEKLEVEITDQLKELNFSNAEFSISIENTDVYTEFGVDNVEFLLSANKGQPLMPLAKVASGGETSRIMLALKSVTADFDGIDTLIFDEIDSGISGRTASIVGEKLRKMSENRQIICITHLPQIAAFADHHYVIDKETDESSTYTTVSEIKGAERTEEIARLLGGTNITEQTLMTAEELIGLSAKVVG
ncbi:MAG: DNA repair protein RecN [Clostridiales Family XIII bacterium]|jgi:DNA repair protein RecN (Recombination protein N)|nr:DNA repair protein RecN [Clostridiales Family XIII bacterium]